MRSSEPQSNIQDGNQLGVAAGCIFGMKKTKFNSVDFGCMTLSTYAA